MYVSVYSNAQLQDEDSFPVCSCSVARCGRGVDWGQPQVGRSFLCVCHLRARQRSSLRGVSDAQRNDAQEKLGTAGETSFDPSLVALLLFSSNNQVVRGRVGVGVGK